MQIRYWRGAICYHFYVIIILYLMIAIKFYIFYYCDDIHSTRMKSDNSSKSEDKPFEPIADYVSNVPVEFLTKHRYKYMFYKNESCAKLPTISGLHFNNINWQIFTSEDQIFQLLGAYYDNRKLSPDNPSVRIISLTNKFNPENNSAFCHFWFNRRSEPIITKVESYLYIWHEYWDTINAGKYTQPYIINCKLPSDEKRAPEAVSIVQKPCDLATNLLKVVYEKTDVKRDFAVCVKGLDFMTDISIRLIEWIELVIILGADVIYMYKLQTHPNVTKVLNYYESTKNVRVIPIRYADHHVNKTGSRIPRLHLRVTQKRRNEVVLYNDCFYRNIHSYNYVVILDVDEVVIPSGGLQFWKKLIEVVKAESEMSGQKYASFYARNVYFMNSHMNNQTWHGGIPKHFHMLQHIYRSSNFTAPKDYVKTFFDTERTLLVHNHLPLACFGICHYNISTKYAQSQHYRKGCERSGKRTDCLDFMLNKVMDTSIWRYKDELILRASYVLKTLGFNSKKKI